MSSENLLSVIIPNYNNGRYIAEAIRSVLKQSIDHWELILVDDCSSDNSLEEAELFLEDERIKIVSNSRNRGVGYSKWKGVSLAGGKVIGTLGGDDMLAENALEEMWDAHQKHPKASLIYSQMYICDQAMLPRHIFEGSGPIPAGESYLSLKNNTVHQVSSFKTFKRASYDSTLGYGKEFRKAADKDIIYKLEEVGELVFLKNPLYYYRHHDRNISLNDNVLPARLWEARAKRKAWRRRKRLNMANLTRKEVLWEYLWTYRQMRQKSSSGHRIPFQGLKLFFPYLYFRILFAIFSRLDGNLKENPG